MTPRQIINRYGDGNLSLAARRLDLSRQTLYNWLHAGKVVSKSWRKFFDLDGKRKEQS